MSKNKETLKSLKLVEIRCNGRCAISTFARTELILTSTVLWADDPEMTEVS